MEKMVGQRWTTVASSIARSDPPSNLNSQPAAGVAKWGYCRRPFRHGGDAGQTFPSVPLAVADAKSNVRESVRIADYDSGERSQLRPMAALGCWYSPFVCCRVIRCSSAHADVACVAGRQWYGFPCIAHPSSHEGGQSRISHKRPVGGKPSLYGLGILDAESADSCSMDPVHSRMSIPACPHFDASLASGQ